MTIGLAGLLACGGSAATSNRGPERDPLARAEAAERDGRDVDARRHYRAAIARKPRDFDAHRRASLFFRGIGEPDEALAIARAYQRRVPGDPRGGHLLADLYFVDRELDAALEVLDRLIARDDEDAAAYHRRGLIWMDRDDVTRARVDLERATALEPENPDFLSSYAFALIRAGHGQSLNKAEGLLERALDIAPEHAEATRLYGTCLRMHLEPKRALDYHLRAIELSPASAVAHFELGITYNALGRNDQAEGALRRALELAPDDAVSWYALGELLRITDRCGRAIDAYERALELEPGHLKATAKLGSCYVQQGDWAKAEVLLSAAVRNGTDDPSLYFRLGAVYDNTGRENAAIKAYDQFIQLAPAGDRDLPAARRRLGELQQRARERP